VTLELLQAPQFDQPPLTKKEMWPGGLQCRLKSTSYNFQERVIILVFPCLFTVLISLYLDIYWCYKLGSGNCPLGNRLQHWPGEDWCKYAYVIVLHFRSSGYSRPRVPSLTNRHLLWKERKKKVSLALWWGLWTSNVLVFCSFNLAIACM